MTIVLKPDPLFSQKLMDAIIRYEKSQFWLFDKTATHCGVLKTMILSNHYKNQVLPTSIALKTAMFAYLEQHHFKPSWASKKFGLNKFRYRTLYYAIEDVCKQYLDGACLREFKAFTQKTNLVLIQTTSEGVNYKQNLSDVEEEAMDWQALYAELKEKRAINAKLLEAQTLLSEQIKQNNALITELKNKLTQAQQEREKERMTLQSTIYALEQARQKDRDEFSARLEKLEKQAQQKDPEQNQENNPALLKNNPAFFKKAQHKKRLKNKAPLMSKNGHTNTPTLINKRGQLS